MRGLNTIACRCGRHATQRDHDEAADNRFQCDAAAGVETRYEGVIATALMRAVFPHDATRRALLGSVGASTALAALAQFFPLKTATEAFAEGAGPLEKKDLKIGFIPITCATPIIMASPMGFYAKHGLDVEVVKTAGWAVVRDKTINKEYDAAHMLAPMPIAISLGLGAQAIPFAVPAIENINGQALRWPSSTRTGAIKRLEGLEVRDPLRLFDAQLLLRYYLAEHGVDLTPMFSCVRCRHRKWSPTCALTT